MDQTAPRRLTWRQQRQVIERLLGQPYSPSRQQMLWKRQEAYRRIAIACMMDVMGREAFRKTSLDRMEWSRALCGRALGLPDLLF